MPSVGDMTFAQIPTVIVQERKFGRQSTINTNLLIAALLISASRSAQMIGKGNVIRSPKKLMSNVFFNAKPIRGSVAISAKFSRDHVPLAQAPAIPPPM